MRDYQACDSIWLLDDFTAANGGTRVVPGSHRSGTLPRLAMADPTAPHPGQVQITGRAGTVVVFNSHQRLEGVPVRRTLTIEALVILRLMLLTPADVRVFPTLDRRHGCLHAI